MKHPLALILCFFLFCAGCTAGRFAVGDGSPTKSATGVLSGDKQAVPHSQQPPKAPEAAYAAEPVEASFSGTASLDRF